MLAAAARRGETRQRRGETHQRRREESVTHPQEHPQSTHPHVTQSPQHRDRTVTEMDEMKEEPEENAIFRPNVEMQLHTEHSSICGSEEDQDSRDSTSYGPHAGFWLQTGLLDPRPPEPGSSSLLIAPPPVPSGPAPFCCALCGAALLCREALTDHLTTHAVGRPPLCALCGTQLHNSGDVRRHMMTHSGEKPFVCDRCHKRFTRRHALHNHQMNCRQGNAGPAPPQQEEAFCCCVCAHSFTTRPALTAHMVVHVGGDPPRCQVCTRKVSPHISNVLRHMMLHSGEKKEASKKRSTPRPTKVCVDAVPPEDETFTCCVCAHRFDSASLLTDHMTNHVIISEACGTCLVCHKTIQKSKNDVRRHMMIHSGEKPYVCVGCGKSFNRNSTLQVHMNICSVAVPVHKESPEKSAEEEDDEEGTFGCCLCEKQFFRKGLLTDHLTTHLSEPPGTCLICGKGVGTKRNDVRRHMMIHSGEKPFSCSQCGMKFNRKFTLRHHNKLCTQGAPQDAQQCDETLCPDDGTLEQGLQVKGEEPEEEVNTRCKFCNESFYEPSQLTEHMAAHTDDITGACLICGKALGRTVAQVRQHMMVHSGEKPFSCSVCGRRFIRTLALKHHMKTHEAGAQQETSRPAHACPVCGQTFKTLTVLKYHMFIHSGVRPFACSVCGKRFRQRGDVRRHMMLHSGERPFSCRACGRSFNRRNALRLHLRTHIAGGVVDEALLDVPAEGADAPDRGLSPVIVCDGCGQGFSRSLHFNRHLSACGKLHRRSDHAPFSCSLCAESFAEKEGLVEHVLTHKDGEYVSCAICNKSLRRGDLKAHLSLHAGEKRHICPSCGKGFSRNTHLRGHMRTHNKHQSPLPSAELSAPPTAVPTDQPCLDLSPAAPPPPTSFRCQICGKVYGKKSSLVSHVAENHKQPSSFKCPVCSKFLRRKSDLKRHLLTHSDNKPFTCRLCGKGFGRSDQLRGHVSAHHSKDELTAQGGASEEGGTGEPQSHNCPDCMFPCPASASYNCPSTKLLLVDCPSCERSFSL